MRRRRKRRMDDERPNRRKRALREIEDREWEEELRYIDESVGYEDNVPAWFDEEETYDDENWQP